jgi:Domain of unknown function (DUF6249)
MDAPAIESQAAQLAHMVPASEPPFADMAAGTAFFVIAFSALVLIYVVLRDRRRHQTISMLVERGQPIPPTLLPRAASRHAEMRRGTWLVALAIGAGVTLYVLTGEMRYAAWGLIPLCLGVASYVNAALFYPRSGSQS